MGACLRDVRLGVRSLVRNPAFSATALLSLSLGIGANGALFSVFNSLLWRPLPVPDPGRVVVLYSRVEGQVFSQGFSYPEFADYAGEARVFSGLAAFSPVEVGVSGDGGENSRAFAEAATGNYFDLLGVRPVLGRTFLASEDGRSGGQKVAILNYHFWQRRFGGDPGVIGRTIRLNDHPFTIVGVAPRGFNGAYAIYFAPNLWIPLGAVPSIRPAESGMLEARGSRGIRLIARLAPDVGLDRARSAVGTIAARLAAAYPDTNRGRTATVYPELATRPEVEISRSTTVVATVFLGLTGLVLLVACANVANLLLARSTARRKEIAMRLALGATRRQLVGQLLTEAAVLALAGGTLGLGLCVLAARLATTIRPPTDIPLNVEIQVDARVVLFTFAVSLLSSLAFGLVPALQASRPAMVPALKGESVGLGASRRRVSLGSALVVAQVAVSLVLLVASGLFIRSVTGARTIDPGFRVEDRLVMSFNPSLVGYDAGRRATFYRLLLERVRQLPGVESATLASTVPLDWGIGTDDLTVEGREVRPGEESIQVFDSVVEPGYFRTLGTVLRSGRAFTDGDTAAERPVVIVNETMARRLWPGQHPIGRRVRLSGPDEPWREVIGVVADGKYRQLTEQPRLFMLLPLAQNPVSGLTLVIHSRLEPSGILASARREAQALGPSVPIFEAKTMARHMERAYLGPRLSAMLIGPAGLLALVIAAIGLSGVMAYAVSRRTRELGIRIAVGAGPAQVLGMVMRQGLGLAAAGLAIGLAVALASARLIANLLFGVTPTDPLTFGGVALLLLAVSAAATYLPARRALKVDPLTALRAD